MIPPEQVQLDQAQQLRHEIARRRFWQLVGVAAGLSVVIHIGVMIYLHLVERAGPSARPVELVMEFPTVRTVEELTSLAHTDLLEPDPESRSNLDQVLEPDTPAPEESAAAELSESDVGATPTLGGSGHKGVSGRDALGGAGGAASFFGIVSQGERFAYIVDRSGSMSGSPSDEKTRLDLATTELMRSIRKLPDYARFFVVFFSSKLKIPSWQDDWLRARANQIRAMDKWIEKEVYPEGATAPLSSFKLVLSLNPPPDVIFFLTDGEIQNMTAEDVAKLNRIRHPAVINTIAFGTHESQKLLEEIARASGGTYRFVSVRSAP